MDNVIFIKRDSTNTHTASTAGCPKAGQGIENKMIKLLTGQCLN